MSEEKKPWEQYKNESQDQKPWEKYEPVKKKEPTVSPSGSEPKKSSSVTQPKKTSGQSASLSKPDGIYTFSGRKDATYKKQDGNWFIDPNGSGKFIPIEKNKEERIKILEKSSERVYNSPFEEVNVEYKKAPVKTVTSKPTDEQTVQQKAFNEDFIALDKNDPVVMEKDARDKRLENTLSTFNKDVVGALNETDFKNNIKKVLQDNPETSDMFDIEETGAGYNAIRIRNKYTGEFRDINLNNWSSERNKDETELLKAFIKVNSKFSDLSKMKSKLSNIQEERKGMTGIDAIEADKEIARLRDGIKLETKLRNNYVLGDKYMAAAVYDENSIKNMNAKIGRIQVDSIDIREQQKSLDEWKNKAIEAVASGKISKEQFDAEYLPKIESEQATITEKASGMMSEINTIMSDFDDAETIAGLNTLAQSERGNVLTGAGKSFMQGVESVVRYTFENTSGLDPIEKGTIAGQLSPGVVTDEYLSSADRNSFESAIFGITNSLGSAAAGSLLVRNPTAGLFASSYMNMKDQMVGPEWDDVPEYEKILLSSTYGVAISALEKFGLDRIFSKTPIGKNAMNWIMANTFKSLPKGATKEVLENTINENIKLAISRGILNTAGGMLVEGGTEGLQEAADYTIKGVYNKIKGKDLFDTPKTIGEALSGIGEASKLGMIGGGMMSGITQAVSIPKDMMTSEQFNIAVNAITNQNLKDIFQTTLKGKVLSGEITKDDALKQVNAMRSMEGTLGKIPDFIPAEKKYDAFKLISERDRLESEITGYEPELVVAQKERVKEINTELQNISKDAVQKQTTDEGVLQPEGSEVGLQEMEQGDTKQEVVTEEGKEEVELIDVYHGGSLDEKTGDIYVTEDKSQATEYAKGNEGQVTKYSVDKNKVATEDTVYEAISELGIDIDDSSKVYELIDPRFEETYIGDENKQKLFNLLKDKGFEAASFIDEDLTLREKGGVRNIVVFEAEKLSPSSVTVTENQVENLYDQGYRPVVNDVIETDFNKDDLGDLFYNSDRIEMAIPKLTQPGITSEAVNATQNEVTLENFAELEAQAAQNNDSERIKTLRAARMVTKALKGVKVFIHNSPEEYQQALANASGDSIDTIKAEETEGRSAGQYVNGEIHIDGTIGSARTVYHEAFHDAILKSGLAVDMAKGLSKIISDKNLRTQINEFVSRYENAEQNEEMIAELGAIMAEAEVELTTTKLQQFKQLINKLAQKLGLPAILPAAADRQQVVDFINSMSRGLREGRVDIMTDGIVTSIPNSVRKSRKVSFKGDYNLSFVQESDIIDFTSLVDDIIAKDQKVWFWVADQLGRGYYFDDVLNGEHYLDAGPSFALDPENRSKGIIWASGMAKKSIEKNIDSSDYIFIISGSPDKSKLFNKSVTELVKNRIEKNVTFKKFKSSILKANPPKGLREILEAYNSFDDLLLGPDRKNFMIEVNNQRSKKGTEARALLDKYGAFINEQDLRDGFFADNGFEQGDVMLVLKPTSVGGKSSHSTYENDILGEVVGIPDVVVNSYDLMPDEVASKFKNEMNRAQQSQIVAPYGSGVKRIQRRKQKADGNKKVTAKKVDQSFKKPVKKVIVNEATALKDQLRLEAKAARESQMDLKQKQRALIVAVNQMKRGGLITVNQASALAKRLAYVNVDNQIMVERFLQYADRLFADAEYIAKIKNARELQRKIKRAIKNGSLQATTVSTAKAFSKINPSLVEDIDQYIEMADKVMNAVKPSRATELAVELKTAMDFNEVGEYTDRAIEFENEYRKNELLSIYNDLADAGIITKDMSIDEMKEVIASVMNETADKMPAEEKRAYIMAWLGKTADVYRPIIQSILKGVDPFSGESVTLTDRQQEIMREFLKLDVTQMDVRDAIAVVEAMDNFITNKVTDGLETVIARYKGAQEAKALKDAGVTTRAMTTFGTENAKSGFGRLWAQEMMSLKTMTDLVFRGVKSAQKITKSIGLTAYENGVALANRLWNNDIDTYYKLFGKLNPNGEKFMTAKNIYERGMYAALKRTVAGDQKAQDAELKRKIKLINDSIATLSKGGQKDREIAKMYAEVAEKLGINEEGVTMLDIDSRVDPMNRDAVNWWVQKWADNYNELADVSQNVYNTILERDMFYTPDKFSSITQVNESAQDVVENNTGAFGQFLEYTYDKKSGVLMPSAKQSSMAEGRFLDLNFDMNNSKSLKAAFVDMKTATAIRQISGFLKSKDWKSVMTDIEERKVFQTKVNNYILRSRGKSTGTVENDYFQALEKAGRIWASMGSSKALGSPLQAAKQTIPVMMNTIINAGRFDVITSRKQNDWVSKIGRGISNRGLESQSGFEDANKLLEEAVNSNKAVKILTWIDQQNTKVLKVFLAKPDVFVARSSFISYYKQYMSQNGLSTDIDFSRPEDANQDALDYAQRMVDRQQNVSDTDMAGEFLSSKDGARKLLKNVILPFASFALNQKSRMFTDLATLRREASKEDKIVALKSLSGLIVEMTTFSLIAWGIKAGIVAIAGSIAPAAPKDEEEEEKQFKRQLGYVFGRFASDVLSPAPIADELVIPGIDMLWEEINYKMKYSSSELEEELAKYNAEREESGQRAITGKEADRWKEAKIAEDRFKLLKYDGDGVGGGVYGITLQKLIELGDSYDVAFKGEYTQDFNGNEQTKYILPEDRQLLKSLWYTNAAYTFLWLPPEVPSLNRRIENNIKKSSSISEKKYDTYNEVKAKKGRNLNKVETFLVKNMGGTKSQSGTERVLEEIDWIERNGGLQNQKQMDKYIEIFERDGSVGSTDLQKIQKLK